MPVLRKIEKLKTAYLTSRSSREILLASFVYRTPVQSNQLVNCPLNIINARVRTVDLWYPYKRYVLVFFVFYEIELKFPAACIQSGARNGRFSKSNCAIKI